VGYPVLCALLGQRYPDTRSGCRADDDLHLRLCCSRRVPPTAAARVIPAAWSLLGSSAAWQFGVGADYALLVVGVVGTTVAMRPPPRRERVATQGSRP
jgi:hypothetical protein